MAQTQYVYELGVGVEHFVTFVTPFLPTLVFG